MSITHTVVPFIGQILNSLLDIKLIWWAIYWPNITLIDVPYIGWTLHFVATYLATPTAVWRAIYFLNIITMYLFITDILQINSRAQIPRCKCPLTICALLLFVSMRHNTNCISLDVKGCICHLAKWQIHPFISKEAIERCILPEYFDSSLRSIASRTM